ncbi:MAG: hypothetical protein ABI632_06885 [Pseudolysinimonas sp.]
MAGPAGTLEAALFYAIMPGDNALPLPFGAKVEFPSDGPSTTSDITRNTQNEFLLVIPGTYRVSVQASVSEPAQLVIALNNVQRAYTVVGRATGTSQITLTTLVTTTAANVSLSVQNPTGNSAFSLTTSAGGGQPVSATLLIELVKAS